MTLTTMQLYWIVKLTDIHLFFCILGSCTIAFGIIAIVIIAVDGDELSKLFSGVTLIGVLFVLIGTLMPTTKQLAAILILPPVINNEQIQQMPQKLVNLSEEWLEELRPKKVNEE